MLNFKWSDGGAEVKWHQDIVFYPHTHSGTMQFLVFLEDVSSEQGPLEIYENSQRGPIFEHYDNEGKWTGAIRDNDLQNASLAPPVKITGSAGTVSVHHSRTIHGSRRNHSSLGRPVLVITYGAADAVPYTAPAYPSSRYGRIVRGVEPGYAHHEEMNVPMPPDWSGGYTSIFDHQDEV
jgi:ectoine hydroxylase-related dioxygenase (phytanoyl-CoA dioxygenase family)